MNTNGNLNGYFPTANPMTIGGVIVVGVLGYLAYQAFYGKKSKKAKR